MDVSFLAPVFEAAGPFATVTADVTHVNESADAELDLRVRAVTEKLTEQGAPEVVVEAVRERLTEGNDGGEAGTFRGRAVVVAADGTVVLDSALADVPRDELAEWSPTPHLLPVLRALPGRVPHVVVVTDRVGADITVAGVPGQADADEHVKADGLTVRRVSGGGLSRVTYQHSAEDAWAQNAERVAEHITSIVRRVGPRFVLVAGEVRARAVLTEHAGNSWSDLVVDMDEGGRAAGADRQPVERRSAELVAEHEARDEADAVEKISSAGAHGLAVTGTANVVEALRKGQVETLVLADPADTEELLVGASPLELGVDRADMDALGSQEVHPVPADQALLAATAAGAAGVVVVSRAAMPGDIPVAAILRYTDDSTPSPQ